MATERDRQAILLQAARERARSADLARRLAPLLHRNTVAVRESMFRRDRRQAMRGEARPLMHFRLEGFLGDQPVVATYDDGGLHADSRLLTHAGLLVDLDEIIRFDSYGVALPATLSGAPEAVLLTLFSACDRVTAVSLDIGRFRGTRTPTR